MPQETLSGSSSWCLSLPEGSRLPSLMLSSPSHLTVFFLWKSLQAGNCRWNVLGCYGGSSVSHLLGCLSQPLLNEPWSPWLPLWFCQDCHSLDPHHHWCPLLLNVPSIQQAFSGGAGYPWVSSGGKKLVVLGLGGPSVVWVLGPWGNSIESSFSASQVALR